MWKQCEESIAHTVLGAAVAAAGGNDALTAGLSAGGAEAAAPKLAQYLYGKDAKDLTADEKSTISAITGLVASGVGATTGDVASTVQSGNVAQNAVEDNLFGVLTADKKIDKQKNNYYFQVLQACKSAECEKNIIMQNTLAAMQNVQKIISVSSTKYNEGDIITNPNDSTGLRYLVVNQNGSLKAKLLPADYQALYSVYELNSSRALVQGGVLASIVANTLKSGHDVFADRSLFTNQEMTALSRTFAGVEVVGNVLMIGGAVAPKSIDLKAAAIHDKNPLKVDAIQHETKRLLVSQGNVPTCGHNSCVMVLDTLKKPVNVENLINSIPPKTDGITFKQVSELLKQNNVENYAFSSRTITQLEQYTSKGTPVIVRIADDKTGFSHFVVVDGVTIRGGKKVVAIRDPHNAS